MIRLMAKKPKEKKEQVLEVMRQLTSAEMMEHVNQWMEIPQDRKLTQVCEASSPFAPATSLMLRRALERSSQSDCGARNQHCSPVPVRALFNAT